MMYSGSSCRPPDVATIHGEGVTCLGYDFWFNCVKCEVPTCRGFGRLLRLRLRESFGHLEVLHRSDIRPPFEVYETARQRVVPVESRRVWNQGGRGIKEDSGSYLLCFSVMMKNDEAFSSF